VGEPCGFGLIFRSTFIIIVIRRQMVVGKTD
jgi:hypothetical protein